MSDWASASVREQCISHRKRKRKTACLLQPPKTRTEVAQSPRRCAAWGWGTCTDIAVFHGNARREFTDQINSGQTFVDPLPPKQIEY